MPRKADFTQKTKDSLASKVGYKCSNPFCRKSTIGANAEGSGTINIGEAAHITAAEPGGARYDSTLSVEQRKSESNGIWLCRNHAAMIDRDEKYFTVDLLHRWKADAEREANARIQGEVPSENKLYYLRVLLDDLTICNEEIEFLKAYERAIVISPDRLPVTNDYENKLEVLVDAVGMKYASRMRGAFRDIDSFKIILKEEASRFKNQAGWIADRRAAVYHSEQRAFLKSVQKYNVSEILTTLEKLFDEDGDGQ